MKAKRPDHDRLSILFDASILGYSLLRWQYRTGIYRVAVSLVRELARRPDVELVVYTSSGNRELCRMALRRVGLRGLSLAGIPLLYDLGFAAFVAGNLLMRASDRVPEPLCSALKWIKILPYGIHRGLCRLRSATEEPLLRRADAYLSPMEIAPSWVRRVAGLSRYTVLHDLIPLLHTDYSIKSDDPTRWFPTFISSLTRQDRLFAVSEHTKQDFLRLFSTVPEEQITPVYNAVDEAIFYPGTDARERRKVWRKYRIPEDRPVLLSVSTLESRKRLDAVLAAFERLSRNGTRSSLVLCGANRQNYRSKLMRGIGEAARCWVVFTGFVPDRDLRVLYGSCRALVYLSEYEGFGLPVLEAMTCGAPVIVADRTSLPEVVGHAGFLVDPDDTEAVARVMRKLVVDEELWRRSAEQSRRRAGRFSWRKCVDLMIGRMLNDCVSSDA